ncbi:MAG TPA: hypothetical protein ENN03_08630 [bacterium]|nr:hypothetical protein [bacterium]
MKPPFRNIFILAAASFLSLAAREKQERVVLERADRLRTVHEQGKLIRILEGDVRFRQGEAFLRCETARQIVEDELVFLDDNVHIFDGKRTLTSQRVQYNGKTRTEIATGDVFLHEDHRTLRGDQVIYNQNSKVARATGRVRINDMIESVELSGDEALYDRNKDYGLMTGRVRAVKIDTSSRDTMTMECRYLEAWGEEQRVFARDSVVITRGNLKAVSETADYYAEEERIVLQKTPKIFFTDQEMAGDTIDMMLDSLKFSGGLIRGNAEIFWGEDSLHRNVLNGKRIRIIASRDTVEQVIVEGQASSVYYIFDENEVNEGVNTVTGDRIILEFNEEGQVKQVLVESSPGLSTGEYKPKEKAKRGRGENL